MCQHAVETEMLLIVRDFLGTEEFKDRHFCVKYDSAFMPVRRWHLRGTCYRQAHLLFAKFS
jgi:hypothetical protein